MKESIKPNAWGFYPTPPPPLLISVSNIEILEDSETDLQIFAGQMFSACQVYILATE